jgi:hypothetical protein
MTRNYDYADDYSDNDILNVSGAPWPGSQMVRRPRTITPSRPGQHVSQRTQTMINAESGERLGTRIERALSQVAGKLSIAESVEQAPAGREMLRHLFGLNLPGRDRA